MTEWKEYYLDEICLDIIDCVNKTAPLSDSPTEYKMLRTSDIRNGNINLEGLNTVTQDTYEKWSRRGKLQVGDIVFTREAPLGEVGLVRQADNIFLGQRLVLFRADPNKCDNLFLLYALMFHDNKQAIIAKGVGSTVLHLRVPECGKIKIKAPELHIQKQIGQILSRYDDLITNHQQQIKLLEEAAQRLYKEWFVDLRFPGCEKVEIVDGVPKGWKYEPLNDVAEVVMGQSPKSDYYNQDGEGLPFHQGVASYGNRYVSNTVYASQYNRVAPEGSILFSVRAPVGRLNITKYKIAIGRGLAAINAKNGKRSFLWYCLKNKFFKDDIIGNGSIFSSITKNDLLAQKLLMPEINILSKFDEIAGNIDDKIEVLDRQLVLLQEARDRLLPKLISGEIEVSS